MARNPRDLAPFYNPSSMMSPMGPIGAMNQMPPIGAMGLGAGRMPYYPGLQMPPGQYPYQGQMSSMPYIMTQYPAMVQGRHLNPMMPMMNVPPRQALIPTELPNDKEVLGEVLFPLVQQTNPESASKITGMLLEMEVDQIHNLIRNPTELSKWVNEALKVT